MLFRKKKPAKIVIHYDAGFPNTLYVRGSGVPGMNWSRGIPLKNTKKDEWIIEIDQPFTSAEFKILINDKVYEQGENHRITPGSSVRITPKFN